MKVLTKAAVQGAACGLMIGAVLLVGGRMWRPAGVAVQVPPVADVVRARSFQAVDAAGKTRAELTLTTDGSPTLALLDAAGEWRALLTLAPEGSTLLGLFDAAGKPRGGLGITSDGIPRLELADAAGKTRAELSLTSDGTPQLRLYDAAGKMRAALGSTSLEVVKTGEERKRSESSMVLFGKDGKVIWEAP